MKKLPLAIVLSAALVALLLGFFFPQGQGAEARSDDGRRSALTKLRALAEGMVMYARIEKGWRLPPTALYSKKGDALLSWRVLLLPYLDQEELYKEFHLDEAWDSPHNRKLLPRIPSVYQRIDGKLQDPSATPYQVFFGKGTAFEGKVGRRWPDEFKDGAKNTLLIVEAAEHVPWTKPADLPYEPKGTLPKLGGQLPDVIGAAFADGTVGLLRKTIPESTLRGFITRNGGEKVNREDFLVSP